MSSAEISGDGKHSSPSPAWPDEAVHTGAGARIGGMDDDKTQVVSEQALDDESKKILEDARSRWKARNPDAGSAEASASPSGASPSAMSSRPPHQLFDSPSSAAIPTASAEAAQALPPQQAQQTEITGEHRRFTAPSPRDQARRQPAAQQGYHAAPQGWGEHTGQFPQVQAQQGYAPLPGPGPQGFAPGAGAPGPQQSAAPAPTPLVANGTLTDGLAARLRQEAFTTEVKPQPQSGWRKAVLKSSFGLINPGESRIERIDRERRAQIAANIPRTEFIFAVMSPRGGVAKTTTTAALGSVFSHVRGGGAIVIDANPNKGSLASRVNPDARATFQDLLADKNVRGVNDIRQYARSNSVQLDVLAGDESNVNPKVYDPHTLVETLNVLRGRYSIIGIDVGQNLQDPVVAQILDVVTAVVVVSGLWYGAGKAAVGMYDWLVENGRADLVARSTLVISDRHPEPNKVFRAGVEENVASTLWKDPVYIPYDHHLYEDTVINVDQLAKPTYRAYLEAAARLSNYYGQPPLPRRRSA